MNGPSRWAKARATTIADLIETEEALAGRNRDALLPLIAADLDWRVGIAARHQGYSTYEAARRSITADTLTEIAAEYSTALAAENTSAYNPWNTDAPVAEVPLGIVNSLQWALSAAASTMIRSHDTNRALTFTDASANLASVVARHGITYETDYEDGSTGIPVTGLRHCARLLGITGNLFTDNLLTSLNGKTTPIWH